MRHSEVENQEMSLLASKKAQTIPPQKPNSKKLLCALVFFFLFSKRGLKQAVAFK